MGSGLPLAHLSRGLRGDGVKSALDSSLTGLPYRERRRKESGIQSDNSFGSYLRVKFHHVVNSTGGNYWGQYTPLLYISGFSDSSFRPTPFAWHKRSSHTLLQLPHL